MPADPPLSSSLFFLHEIHRKFQYKKEKQIFAYIKMLFETNRKNVNLSKMLYAIAPETLGTENSKRKRTSLSALELIPPIMT